MKFALSRLTVGLQVELNASRKGLQTTLCDTNSLSATFFWSSCHKDTCTMLPT